jgi:hypothetical protein
MSDTVNFNEKDLISNPDMAYAINYPSHYTEGAVECIDAIESSMSKNEFLGYLKGNVIKYIWRYRLKGREAEDLRKAQWYLNRLVDSYDS